MTRKLIFMALLMIFTIQSAHRMSVAQTDDAWFTLENVVQAQFSPDSRFLAVRTSTHFRVYDIQQPTPVVFIETEAIGLIHFEAPIGFSPDGRFVVVNSVGQHPTHTIHIWDTTTGEEVAAISDNFHTVTGFLFSPTEPILMIAHQTGGDYWMGKVSVWDYEQNRIIDSFEPGGGPNLLSFSSDGNYSLIQVGNGTGGWVIRYNVNSGQIERFSSGMIPVDCPCDVSPTWEYSVVSTPSSYNLIVLELPSGENSEHASYADGYYGGSDWNNDGSLLAMVEPTGRVRIFDMENDRSWTVGVGIEPYRLRKIDIHPTQNLILLSYQDEEAEVWDMETSQLQFITSTVPRYAAGFSPNGDLILGGNDTGYSIWDSSSGQLLHSFEIEEIQTVPSISPDGHFFLARTFFEGPLWVWRLDETEP